jgi:hypothetical protein
MGLIWGFCPLLSAFKVEVAGIVKQRKITGNNGRTDFRFQFPRGSGGSSPLIRTNEIEGVKFTLSAHENDIAVVVL